MSLKDWIAGEVAGLTVHSCQGPVQGRLKALRLAAWRWVGQLEACSMESRDIHNFVAKP